MPSRRCVSARYISIGLLAISARTAPCQQQAEASKTELTMCSTYQNSWWWVSAQANMVSSRPIRRSRHAISGPLSINRSREHATSEVFTLYTGAQVSPTTEILFHMESAGGRGISDALGLARFTNLDVVRNPRARANTIHCARHLSPSDPIRYGKRETGSSGPFGVLKELPVRGSTFALASWAPPIISTPIPQAATAICSFSIGPWTTTAHTTMPPTHGDTRVGAMLEYHDRSV